MNEYRIDDEFVIYRLEEAGRTLLALPSAGCYPSGVKSGWVDVVHEFIEAYGYSTNEIRPAVPTSAAISRMDEAFAWLEALELLPGRPGSGHLWSTHGGATLRKIVIMRSLVGPITGRHLYSWRRVGDYLHCDHKSAKAWHGQAIRSLVDHVRKKSLHIVKKRFPYSPRYAIKKGNLETICAQAL